MGNTPGELALPEDWEPYFRRFDQASQEQAAQLGLAAPTNSKPPPREAAYPLRYAGGESCPRPGWWLTPAKANSRRYFQKGETFPDYPGSDYGSTFWQWSPDQDVPRLL
jgi:hypothetical protein